jgi:DNA-binding IclR family transcriptional regulator
VGAPLFGKNGEAIDALSISSHLEKILESSQIENLARSLLATSGEISRALQYS